MNCGGHSSYKILPHDFPLQNGTSYFALHDDDRLIVALDPAYHSTDLYMDGSLGTRNPLTMWLDDTLARP